VAAFYDCSDESLVPIATSYAHGRSSAVEHNAVLLLLFVIIACLVSRDHLRSTSVSICFLLAFIKRVL